MKRLSSLPMLPHNSGRVSERRRCAGNTKYIFHIYAVKAWYLVSVFSSLSYKSKIFVNSHDQKASIFSLSFSSTMPLISMRLSLTNTGLWLNSYERIYRLYIFLALPIRMFKHFVVNPQLGHVGFFWSTPRTVHLFIGVSCWVYLFIDATAKGVAVNR